MAHVRLILILLTCPIDCDGETNLKKLTTSTTGFKFESSMSSLKLISNEKTRRNTTIT